MKNAVDSVVLTVCPWIAGEVKNNETRQVFQLHNFPNVGNNVISKIKFHQKMKVFYSVKPRNFVVFQTELREAGKRVEVLNLFYFV